MTYSTVFFKSEFCPMTNNFATISLFKPLLKILLALPLFFLLSSCAELKYGNKRFLCQPPSENSSSKELVRYQNERKAAKHWLYCVVPRHRCQIRWYDIGHWVTWVFFGNDDEGIFGESPRSPYNPYCKNNTKKAMRWWIRNPLHNFTHYTIGSAYRVNSEYTLFNANCHGICCCHYTPVATRNYGSKCSSFYLALHGGKPLISLRLNYPRKKKTEFYIGWRKEGNFGIKFHPMVDVKKQKESFLQMEEPTDPN